MRTFNIIRELVMNQYEESKTARRVAAIVYLLILAIVMGGTYLSEQEKADNKVLLSSKPVP